MPELSVAVGSTQVTILDDVPTDTVYVADSAQLSITGAVLSTSMTVLNHSVKVMWLEGSN